MGHVNVTENDGTIVLEPTGRFDREAARLLGELVEVASRADAAVVVDFGHAGPATRDGLALLPAIEARAAAVRNHPEHG